MNDHLLRVATFNLAAGGWDGDRGYARLEILPQLIAQIPDLGLLLFQEGKWFRERGQKLRFRTEELLAEFGLRSYLTAGEHGPMDELVFAAPPLTPITHHTPDLPDVHDDQVGWLRFRHPELPEPLAAKSAHWAHHSGDVRLEKALGLTRYAAPELLAILGGDTNCQVPDRPGHEPEFEPDWEKLPPHLRSHKTLPPGLRPDGELVGDRRALQVLIEAGMIDAGCVAGDITPTVGPHVDNGQGARIDHLLFSPALAPAIVPGSYRVHTEHPADEISDHRMVSVLLDLHRTRNRQAATS